MDTHEGTIRAGEMESDTVGVQRLYTEKLNAYRRFISLFRSRDAIRALLEGSGLLGPKLRVLDAGAGFGTATFALLNALRHRGIEAEAIEAFDLTPAMLARFQKELDSRGVFQVRLKQTNVLELDQQLPSSWSNYDLIVSTSMLEYVARPDLSQALSVLGARLARHGTLLVVITRKNWVTRVLIERWWQAARYSREELREAFAIAGFRSPVFSRFPYRYCWHSLPNHVAGWIAPVVTGLVVDKTGRFFWAFIITAVIALLGSLSWIFIVGALRQVDWSTRPAYADSR